MVATYSAEKLLSRSERKMYDFDPDSGSESIVDLVPGATGKALPIANFKRFVAGLVHTVGTGTVTTFKIYASEDADLATNATAVVAHAIGSNPDAVGDNLWLECDADQIREVLPTAAYVGVKITLNTSTDECIVFFERAEPYYPKTGLTADYVS